MKAGSDSSLREVSFCLLVFFVVVAVCSVLLDELMNVVFCEMYFMKCILRLVNHDARS